MKHLHINSPKLLTNLLWFFSIFIFINAFNFQHNPPSGWQQQYLPFLNNRPLADMDFVDSLVGFGVTGDGTGGDTNHIIKTTNGGEKWFVVQSYYKDLTTIKFLNSNTGFACGGLNGIGAFITKTTDAGISWTILNGSPGGKFLDMHVLSEDTIWGADGAGLVGGLWRTTDGGVSWLRQYGGITGNPDGIYMYNARLGFMSRQGNRILMRTIDGGFNWNEISGTNGYFEIASSDSNTFWKTLGDTLKRSTDIGLTWINISLPLYANVTSTIVSSFSIVNEDTLWGCGGWLRVTPELFKGILYRTTNRGNNWSYQLPDTVTTDGWIRNFIIFRDQKFGWAYSSFRDSIETGIHTVNGGDTSFITRIDKLEVQQLNYFLLEQNYPNPFNPSTKIRFILRERGFCRLAVFDIAGREVRELTSREYPAGEWEAEFDGTGLPAGVYFARMEFTGQKGIAQSDTRKMLLIK